MASSGLLVGQLTPSSELVVPKVWMVDAKGALAPLKSTVPLVPNPSDQGVRPQEGDDTRPPNALRAEKLNRIVGYGAASLGFSSSQGQRCATPVSTSYEIQIDDPGESCYSLRMAVTMDFENPHPGESMVVWMKRAKQLVSDGHDSPLVLVDTKFFDLVDGQWVCIDTDIRFSAEAEAVARSVMETDSGQTVGRVVSAGALDDVKLGPVGERGRVVFAYRCEDVYSYAEMSLGSSSVESRQLVPLAVHLPHAPLDSPGGRAQLSVAVRGPPGSRSLDLLANVLAVQHLKLSSGEAAGNILLPLPGTDQRGAVEYSFSTTILPPAPTCLLFWLSCPTTAEGEWELVGGVENLEQSCVTLQRPEASDAHYLRSPMPGLAPECHLYRCTVTPHLQEIPADVLRVHTDVVISDASGSTCMALEGGGHSVFGAGRTMRSEFSRQEVRRFLRRFESIPLLVRSGTLRPQDIWRQAFCVFDHAVREYWSFECKAGDVSAELVKALLARTQAPGGPPLAANGLLQAAIAANSLSTSQAQLLAAAVKTVEALQKLKPGGTTASEAAASHVASRYTEEVRAHQSAHAKLWKTTFVNWDTDGGNNHPRCYEAVQKLRERADVVGGFVMGVGAWVDQECATRLAKILRGPCVLSLHFPTDDAQDAIFRRDLHHWIQAMKTATITATVSAGSVSWEARHGTRKENAVDCLAATVVGPKSDAVLLPEFDLPDVSEMDHAKAVLKGLTAGKPVVLYLMSRLPFDELARRLRVDFSVGGPASVASAGEQASGTMLAHRWMQVLSGRGGAVQRNKHSLVPQVQQLLEDSLSFNFNLPSTSGSTARLGRARTAHRAPVAPDKQPREPSIDVTVQHGEAWDAPDAAPESHGPSAHGCFGGQLPLCTAPGAALPSLSQTSAGMQSAPMPGAAPPLMLPTMAQMLTMPIGTAPCAMAFGGGGALAKQATPAVSARLFGSPAAAGPPTMDAPRDAVGGRVAGGNASCGLFGSSTASGLSSNMGSGPFGSSTTSGFSSHNGSGLFGGAHGNGPTRGSARWAKGGGKGGRGHGGLSGQADPMGHGATGPVVPSQLLKNSGWLGLLDSGRGLEDFSAVLARITFLIKSCVTGDTTVGPPAVEDALVSQLLGSAPEAQSVAPASGVVHHNYTCDGCSKLPIVGNRYKSVTSADFDLCSQCMATSSGAAEHAFVAVADPAQIIRHSLRVVLQWFQLLNLTEVPAQLQSLDIDSLSRAALLALACQVFGVAA